MVKSEYEERVVNWADVLRDVISAVSYQPDGKGFVVGSLSGTCRFYVASGKHFQLEAQIRVNGKKRTSGNKITGIQKNHRGELRSHQKIPKLEYWKELNLFRHTTKAFQSQEFRCLVYLHQVENI